MRRALITGITGQDGLYLAELLAGKGYSVYGLMRGQNNPKAEIVRSVVPEVVLIDGDLTDQSSLLNALQIAQPDEVYNLAAMSFVGLSWQQPTLTASVTGMGVLRMLEAIRVYTHGHMDRVRFYQASSSEMFGKIQAPLQSETTLLYPRSPYGVAKAFGHHMTINYRESYGAFACSGILFNHESPRRGYEFVTRKVSRAVARISLGLQDDLTLGNLESKRDWGYAADYVEAMWLMLQQESPEDYVIATGRAHSIRDLLDAAFAHIGVREWAQYVKQDASHFRPAEVDVLLGDPAKAEDKLGWRPKVGFEALVRMMVDADLANEANIPSRSLPVPELV